MFGIVGLFVGTFVTPDTGVCQAFQCGGVIDAGQEYALDCDRQSQAWQSRYKWQASYVPGSALNNDVVKTIKIAIHVWQDGSGNGNYPEGQTTIDALTASINDLSIDRWSNNDQPSDPLSGVPYVVDAGLRAELVGIFFHQNQTIYTNSCGNMDAMNAAAIAAHPEVERCINLHIAKPGCWPNDGLSYANYLATPNHDHHSAVMTQARTNAPIDVGRLGGIWAHEIGHLLGLLHTYNFQRDICTYAHPDFLSDVFGDGPEDQPWCVNPIGTCDVCMHATDWGCDPYSPQNTCTNNMMGGTSASGYFSPFQLGRQHRTLALYGARKYAWGYSPTPYTVLANETWDFNIKFYQDIVVPNGITLTLQCIVEMVPEAKVIVEPGGHLIIDGGKITAARFSDTFWGGIEVWGNSNEHQGLVILKNGAVIEHAREAIRLWKPGNWDSMGGVVQVQGTPTQVGATFLNCRRSAEFMQHRNFVPGNPSTLTANLSYFNYAKFLVDDGYRGGDDFEGHVTLWGVDGVQFRACSFENAQTTVTDSQHLGKGILSLDANYSVGGYCTVALPYGTPCPDENLDRGGFVGLGSGIYAADGGSGRGFAAGSLAFNNNIVGLYAEGLPGFSAIRNRFVIGGRSADLTGEVHSHFLDLHQRGISTQKCHGFRIEENTFSPAASVQANGMDAIVIENSGSNSTQVYKNTATGMTSGYVAEGNCIDNTHASAIGHEFTCNTNTDNEQNFWVRKDDYDDPNTAAHGERTQQGSNDVPTGNTFDQGTGEGDYKNSTAWVINYWHAGGVTQPIAVTPGWVGVTLATGSNHCPSRVSGKEVKMNAAHRDQAQNTFLASKAAYINTAYVYQSLLDGGNTPAVVEEVVASWPQDAWDLRNYLMGKSPYLSTEVLQEMMKKNILPHAMVLEICLANPEATKKDGFTKWAEYEAPNPLPSYMIDLIAGSWAPKTFRMELEAQMGRHHTNMSVAADELQAAYRLDEETIPLDAMLAQWTAMPNYGARFAEAELLMRKGQYAAARTLIQALGNHYPLKGNREAERDRTVWYMDQLLALETSGRSVMQLTANELAQWQSFAETANDIPGNWAANVLCFGYKVCVERDGTAAGANKALRPRTETTAPEMPPYLVVAPNPAASWATFTYTITTEINNAQVRVLDTGGREVADLLIRAQQGELLWDTREVPAGLYTVELINNGARLTTERLVVHPTR